MFAQSCDEHDPTELHKAFAARKAGPFKPWWPVDQMSLGQNLGKLFKPNKL